MNDQPRSHATIPRPCLRLLLFLLVAAVAATAPADAATGPTPVAVSPGVTAGGGESVTGSCPTFSWTLGGDGEPELLVYELDESEVEEPRVALKLILPPGASSWSPPRGECLEPGGRYAWTVRAAGGDWAEPALFRVESAPSREEVARAIETLRRHLGAQEEVDEASGRAAGAGAGANPEPAAPRDRVPLLAPRQAQGEGSPGGGPVQAAAPRAVEAAALRPASAPSLGSPSLTLSDDLALGSESNVFKDGSTFLWDDITGNTALGRLALSLASGSARDNTAVGMQALRNATGTSGQEGAFNTAVGVQALEANTTGSHNTAIGFRALWANTTGTRNAGIGLQALVNNLTGAENTAIGDSPLFANTSGSKNTAIGRVALLHNTEGHRNVAVGYGAGSEVSGAGRDDNIFISNEGESTDSGKIRIGTQGIQNATFIAGIHGAATGQAGGQAVLVDADGQLGTASCGTTYVATADCPVGGVDGPKCDRVPVGSYCEGDGECGTATGLDNCGTFDWYLRIE